MTFRCEKIDTFDKEFLQFFSWLNIYNYIQIFSDNLKFVTSLYCWCNDVSVTVVVGIMSDYEQPAPLTAPLL